MKYLLSLIALSTLSMTCIAQDVYSEQFQTVQKIELLELTLDEHGNEIETIVESKPLDFFMNQFGKSQGVQKVNVAGVIMITKQLIALGKEIYEIVEAGKPVVNTNSSPIEVLPRDKDGSAILAMDMTNWRAPVVKKYKVQTKNYLGMSPASFEFMLIYSYGGQFEDKGRYITGAQIKTTRVNVKWGYSLDANFKLETIMNQGSSDEPVAGAVLAIDYKISTVLQEMRESKTFFVNGLGQTTEY